MAVSPAGLGAALGLNLLWIKKHLDVFWLEKLRDLIIECVLLLSLVFIFIIFLCEVSEKVISFTKKKKLAPIFPHTVKEHHYLGVRSIFVM